MSGSHERCICIHGHFYQPPRENPWLETVEQQDSAYPYHDWNERVAAECYAPNAASRILDERGRILRITNNYAKISFNFGPTLLSWLERHQPETYNLIRAADSESRDAFGGHGSAMAQAYNHMIMPLANERDKQTQAVWGVADFRHRFGRDPEGMWLPETAVDLDSLEALAAQGIKFTVLAPHQAARVRALSGKDATLAWRDVRGGRIDPTMPYWCRLPSGRSIVLFFYDGPVSRGVAFEGLLSNGVALAERLAGLFFDGRKRPQLVHIATDGESYGHHHRFGEMALSYALHHIESKGLARLTNYAYYLEQHPPTHEVEIIENTSWSCAHGVERWQSDCGCHSGRGGGWNQQWRRPLRVALDWLRDTVAPLFEYRGRDLLRDPWAARDAYISVVLDRSPDNVERFLAAHAARPLADDDKVTALRLLELQRNAMLMYTSCGWFFDDISGIETVQVILYAARCVQLAKELFGMDLEAPLRERLRRAKSNIPAQGDGAAVYDRHVPAARVDLAKVGAHYAITSLFTPYPERTGIHAFEVTLERSKVCQRDGARLVVGQGRVMSQVTRESQRLDFGVLHLGGHDVTCGVRPDGDEPALAAFTEAITGAFESGDVDGAARQLDEYFSGATFSLRSLFRDEQRKVLGTLIESTLDDVAATYQRLFERHAPLMRFIAEIGMPQPPVFRATAEFAANFEMAAALEAPRPDVPRLRAILAEAQTWGLKLDLEGHGYALQCAMERLAAEWQAHPRDADLAERLDDLAGLARELPFRLNLWKVQNAFYAVREQAGAAMAAAAETGDKAAARWIRFFRALGEKLMVRVE
ncbi:MAG: DUF3536 domain-containing protein [Candidatus Sumerlaeaceae bacterium]|nr:DUF3536 domain-containing protein [Candidatus Sumerlaeaceae bacterium]